MNDEKYPFFDVPEEDVSPLFTTKLQKAAQVGCLRGVFDGGRVAMDRMRANLPKPDFNYVYRRKAKSKQNRGER